VGGYCGRHCDNSGSKITQMKGSGVRRGSEDVF
jgi:hypothetical protein